MKRIGIIGGMGAAAGSRMFDLLIKEYQRRGAVADHEFPEIIVHSLASIGLDAKGVANYDALREDLTRSVTMLNAYEVDHILIACNSAHQDFDYLQSISRAKILNMIENTAARVGGLKKVGVMSSTTTREQGLYSNSLAARGIKALHPTDAHQAEIDSVIARVIAGQHGYMEQCAITRIAQILLTRGAERVILGCTELPIASFPHPKFIDPSVELVRLVASL